ncbi:MAG: hypothetical protein ACI4RJ_05455 [Alphaproteobacteria bacterium]
MYPALARRGCCFHHAGVCGCGRFGGCAWFYEQCIQLRQEAGVVFITQVSVDAANLADALGF